MPRSHHVRTSWLTVGVGSNSDLKWIGGHRSFVWFQSKTIYPFRHDFSLYVPLLLSTIQNGPVHLNRSFPGIEHILVWETSTSLPIMNIFSFCFWCRSTNVIVQHYFCSSAHIAYNLLSSKTSSCSFRTYSDCSSSSLSMTCTCNVGT